MLPRILIADDHSVFREGLKSLLATHGFSVVGEAANGRAALKLARTTEPDIAILDVAMPELNGLETARLMARDAPNTRCIVLTMHSEEAYVVEALRAGVKGFVLKSQAFEDVIAAIRTVGAGSVYLSPGISGALVNASLGKVGVPDDPLTTREREVLQLVAEGRTSKAIADVLAISIKTVETHRGAIMRKLDIHDTPTLVRYAIRRGMIQV